METLLSLDAPLLAKLKLDSPALAKSQASVYQTAPTILRAAPKNAATIIFPWQQFLNQDVMQVAKWK